MEFLMNRLRLATVVENILVNKTLANEGRQSKLHLKPNIQAEIENQADKILARYRGQEIQAQAKIPDLAPVAVENLQSKPTDSLKYLSTIRQLACPCQSARPHERGCPKKSGRSSGKWWSRAYLKMI